MMKWNAGDAEKFAKGLSPKQRKKWAVIANSALESCLQNGGDRKDCERRAVRIATSKFEKQVPFNGIAGMEKIMQKIQVPANSRSVTISFEDAEEKKITPDPEKEKPKFPASEDFEMEIFRVGTHNGDKYKLEDLEEIASNFHKLKDELRPKLKITHRENQESLGGLASYGDIVDVYIRETGGEKRLFARVSNTPKEVLDFIKERRFPERSIEIYPEFKLGTNEESPTYRNVLKAVALLGHEMPAVPGMAAIKLEECLECQGTSCFVQKFEEEKKPETVSKEAELSMATLNTGLMAFRENLKV